MNTMRLLQDVCSAWLSTDDQTQIPANAASDMLRAVNFAQSEVWRRLPVHYRQKQISVQFGPPDNGTVTVAADRKTLSAVSFPSVPNLTARIHSAITIAGDALENQFMVTSLLHPWAGTITGTPSQAVLSNNSQLIPYYIERITSPMRDLRADGQVWSPALNLLNNKFQLSGWREYQMSRFTSADYSGMVFTCDPRNIAPSLLSAMADVAPVPFNLHSSQRPIELPYDEEVGSMIVGICGQMLATHRFFDRERLNPSDAAQAARLTRDQLAGLPQSTSSLHNPVATPCGF